MDRVESEARQVPIKRAAFLLHRVIDTEITYLGWIVLHG